MYDSTMSDLARLYQQEIIRHAGNPVGYQVPIEVTHRFELDNPLCGDRIEMMLQINGEQIKALAFDGEGCGICVASASLLCQNLSDHSIQQLREWRSALESSLKSKEDCADSSLAPLMGVRTYPSRVNCALLPWKAAVTAAGDGSS